MDGLTHHEAIAKFKRVKSGTIDMVVRSRTPSPFQRYSTIAKEKCRNIQGAVHYRSDTIGLILPEGIHSAVKWRKSELLGIKKTSLKNVTEGPFPLSDRDCDVASMGSVDSKCNPFPLVIAIAMSQNKWVL